MAFMKLVVLVAISMLQRLSVAAPTDPYCKPQPGDPHWPSQTAWHALNASVDGRLIDPTPPGAVCHPSWPQYDKGNCAQVAKSWLNSQFHALNLFSADYNDETCLPSADAPCSSAGYPSYVIESVNPKDVQEGVWFAQKTGVRLIVKATGHDFPGR